MGQVHFLRSGSAGSNDLQARVPELWPLRDKSIAIFGVGCLGAPCALELARAGIAHLRLVDFDHVEPATVVRWPIGFTAAGLPKVVVLQHHIESNYPWTRVSPHPWRVGTVPLGERIDGPLESELTQSIMNGASLILDATAELGVQQYLAEYAKDNSIPYVCVSGTGGAWGGKIFRYIPGEATGCWLCYRRALMDGTIAVPSSRPDDDVQTTGCADPTFTGTNFDMMPAAMVAVRFAVSTLCSGVEGGYPALPWDVMTVELRDAAGAPLEPRYRGYRLGKDPNCPSCR